MPVLYSSFTDDEVRPRENWWSDGSLHITPEDDTNLMTELACAIPGLSGKNGFSVIVDIFECHVEADDLASCTTNCPMWFISWLMDGAACATIPDLSESDIRSRLHASLEVIRTVHSYGMTDISDFNRGRGQNSVLPTSSHETDGHCVMYGFCDNFNTDWRGNVGSFRMSGPNYSSTTSLSVLLSILPPSWTAKKSENQAGYGTLERTESLLLDRHRNSNGYRHFDWSRNCPMREDENTSLLDFYEEVMVGGFCFNTNSALHIYISEVFVFVEHHIPILEILFSQSEGPRCHSLGVYPLEKICEDLSSYGVVCGSLELLTALITYSRVCSDIICGGIVTIDEWLLAWFKCRGCITTHNASPHEHTRDKVEVSPLRYDNTTSPGKKNTSNIPVFREAGAWDNLVTALPPWLSDTVIRGVSLANASNFKMCFLICMSQLSPDEISEFCSDFQGFWVDLEGLCGIRYTCWRLLDDIMYRWTGKKHSYNEDEITYSAAVKPFAFYVALYCPHWLIPDVILPNRGSNVFLTQIEDDDPMFNLPGQTPSYFNRYGELEEYAPGTDTLYKSGLSDELYADQSIIGIRSGLLVPQQYNLFRDALTMVFMDAPSYNGTAYSRQRHGSPFCYNSEAYRSFEDPLDTGDPDFNAESDHMFWISYRCSALNTDAPAGCNTCTTVLRRGLLCGYPMQALTSSTTRMALGMYRRSKDSWAGASAYSLKGMCLLQNVRFSALVNLPRQHVVPQLGLGSLTLKGCGFIVTCSTNSIFSICTDTSSGLENICTLNLAKTHGTSWHVYGLQAAVQQHPQFELVGDFWIGRETESAEQPAGDLLFPEHLTVRTTRLKYKRKRKFLNVKRHEKRTPQGNTERKKTMYYIEGDGRVIYADNPFSLKRERALLKWTRIQVSPYAYARFKRHIKSSTPEREVKEGQLRREQCKNLRGKIHKGKGGRERKKSKTNGNKVSRLKCTLSTRTTIRRKNSDSFILLLLIDFAKKEQGGKEENRKEEKQEKRKDKEKEGKIKRTNKLRKEETEISRLRKLLHEIL